MTGILQLEFEQDAIVRGGGHIRHVHHNDISVELDGPEEVGLLVNLSGAHRVEGTVDGRFVSSVPRPGSVSVIPPSCKCLLQTSGSCSVLMLRVDWRSVVNAAEQADIERQLTEVRPRFNAVDPYLARLLFDAAVEGLSDTGLFRQKIAAHLVADSISATKQERSVGLGGAALRRVLECCHSLGPEMPRLADLASEAGLSQYHFARSFKLATGYSPHAYLLRCRTERAMDLLARTRSSVAAISREVGFTHSSHLARHIRRATGLSPDRYRREMLP